MKKSIFLLISILYLSLNINAQPWVDAISNNNNQIKFKQTQEAFYSYWNNKPYVKGKGYKQFKRWEYFWETRINKQESTFPTPLQMSQAIEWYEKEANKKNRSDVTTGNWINLGPSSSGGGYAGVGRVSSIAFHPSNSNIFWVATPAGGVWQTTNGGSSWTTITDDNDVLTTTTVAIPSDFASSNTIYIGTGDGDGNRHSSGLGIFKSTDGGSTWQTTGLSYSLSQSFSVNKIIIHPTNTSILYASTTEGVYKTTNGGDNWTKVLNVNYVTDLEFNPADPSIVYVGHRYWGRIYKLTNNGSNSSMVYDGYNDGASRVELSVTANNPSIVIAVVANDESGLKEILKSTDNGNTFTAVYTPAATPTAEEPNILAHAYDGDDVGGQGWYDLDIIIDPSNENIIYCGGINTWKSTNGGASWAINNFWYETNGVQAVHADKHYFAFNGSTLYECNDGGVYKTSNGGNSWTLISNGIINSQMYKLSVSQKSSTTTLTGLQDNGTKLYTSSNWYDVKGGDGMECLIDYSNNNIQYGTYTNGQISRTTNFWSSTTDIEPVDAGEGAWVTPYIIDPNTPTTLYAGYADVWKTTNRGDSWTKISTMNSSEKLRSMAISKSNTNYIYVADLNNIWKTTNGGSSWTNITNNLPVSSSSITSIEVKNDNENTIWVTLGGYTSNVVMQSTNGGTTWLNISSGLPNIPASTIIQNTQNTNETELYVGTDLGVYIKVGNDNWTVYSTGMPKAPVSELDIYYDNNPANSRIRAATFGRGLWESELYYKNDIPSNGDTLFISDFSNSSLWTTNGGWVIGTSPAAGPYSKNMIIKSTTAANNFAMFDSDAIGNVTSGGTLTVANSIDCSNKSNIVVEFETYFKEWNSTVTLEVSTNNSNWNAIPLFSDYANNQLSDNPYVYRVDISSYADNQPTVWIRFNYVGEAGYALFIDDLYIKENYKNDIEISESLFTTYNANASNQNLGCYYFIPEQLTDSLVFYAKVSNKGINNQTNIKFDVTINDGQNDLSKINGESISLFTSGYEDSVLYALSLYKPTAKAGTIYNIIYNVSQDETDELQFNNTDTIRIAITDSVYSRSNIINTTISDSYYTEGGNGSIIGNKYHTSNQVKLVGLRAGISSYTNKGCVVKAQLLSSVTKNVLAESAEYTTTGDESTLYLKFTSPYTSEKDSNYIAGFLVVNAAQDSAFVLKAGSNDVQVYTYSTSFYGANSSTWYYLSKTPWIDLVVKNLNSYSEISAFDCNSYTSPSGKYTWTNSGKYMDTIPSLIDGDSIITVNLTIGNSTRNLKIGTCYQYSSPSGKYIWTNSGTYLDTIPNYLNCDSIITINLTIYNNSSSNLTVSSCDTYTTPSGQEITTTGIIIDTIPNFGGCDSIITIDLTIYNTPTNIDFEAQQVSFTAPPFVIQLNNNTPNISEFDFTWNFGDGQFLESNNTSISHEYDFNGLYDVSLTATNKLYNCVDSLSKADYISCSGGTDIDASIWEINQSNLFIVYPNPAKEEINIELNENILTKDYTLEIVNISGQILATTLIKEKVQKIDVKSFESGIYLIKLFNSTEIHYQKLFIK